MKECVALRKVAILTELGFSARRAQDLVGQDIDVFGDLEGHELGRHLRALANLREFQNSSEARSKLRTYGWLRLGVFLLLLFMVLRGIYLESPLAELFAGMNLKLPPPTKFLMEPSPWLLLPFLAIPWLWWRSRRELGKENNARACWELLSSLSLGVPFSAAFEEKVHGKADALTALVLCSAQARGQLPRIARTWARSIAWELQCTSEKRFRTLGVSLILGVFCQLSFSGLACMLPFYSLTG